MSGRPADGTDAVAFGRFVRATVTSARLQPDGYHDWLLWARACLEHRSEDPEAAERVVTMLEADGGEFLSFALVATRKNAPTQ